jgi:hypothetical protein
MHTLIEVDQFPVVQVPDDGDSANSANLAVPSQRLADRTRYLLNRAPLAAVKETDLSRSNDATESDDPELLVSLIEAGIYEIEALLLFDFAAAANGGIRAGVASTVAASWAKGIIDYRDYDVTETGGRIEVTSLLASADLLFVADAVSSINGGAVRVQMTARLAGAAVLSVQWAQDSSNASPTTLERGSFLRATRIAL